jgi:hypothetical protein
MSNHDLFDWWTSITQTGKNIVYEETDIKSYNPYLMNRFLSYHLDCILLVNEMNMHSDLSKDTQYHFYINSLRKRQRKLSKFFKKETLDDLESIKTYYGYNNKKALQALKVLTKEQINYIKEKLEIGGMVK